MGQFAEDIAFLEETLAALRNNYRELCEQVLAFTERDTRPAPLPPVETTVALVEPPEFPSSPNEPVIPAATAPTRSDAPSPPPAQSRPADFNERIGALHVRLNLPRFERGKRRRLPLVRKRAGVELLNLLLQYDETLYWRYLRIQHLPPNTLKNWTADVARQDSKRTSEDRPSPSPEEDDESAADTDSAIREEATSPPEPEPDETDGTDDTKVEEEILVPSPTENDEPAADMDSAIREEATSPPEPEPDETDGTDDVEEEPAPAPMQPATRAPHAEQWKDYDISLEELRELHSAVQARSLEGITDLVLYQTGVVDGDVEDIKRGMGSTPRGLKERREAIVRRFVSLSHQEQIRWNELMTISHRFKQPAEELSIAKLFLKQRGIDPKRPHALAYARLIQVPRDARTEVQSTMLTLFAKEFFGYEP